MNDYPPHEAENPDLEQIQAEGEAAQHEADQTLEPQPTFTLHTEKLLLEIGAEINDSLLSHLKICAVMLELSDQADVQQTVGGLHTVLKTRWQRRISDVWISQHWGVADRLLRHVALEFLHGAGWQEFDVLYQAAIWIGDQKRKPFQALTPLELAQKALETFSVLNRDEARAYRDPSSAVRLDTRDEQRSSAYPTPAPGATQSATAHYTPPGTFPVSTITRYEAGMKNFVATAAQVLESQGESALTDTLALECMGDLLTGFGIETVAALLRVHGSGSSGADGSRLLAMYLLAEIGCDPSVLREIGLTFAAPVESRTAHDLARRLLDAADANAAVTGEVA